MRSLLAQLDVLETFTNMTKPTTRTYNNRSYRSRRSMFIVILESWKYYTSVNQQNCQSGTHINLTLFILKLTAQIELLPKKTFQGTKQ